ncbi:small acid-soluble spore protein O [Ureibacillus sp. NPDC094379]
MSNNRKSNISGTVSDKQAVRKNSSREFDHELANEPLTAAERLNNKKTKKRQ